jgi:prepilin-type N-terminal cleavage/methylation domain-containing protein/prepilin-type processing-associated H-X9-DG protein
VNHKLGRNQAGLTLIEVMVTVSIMSALTLLLFQGLHNVRERAKIQYCQNNLRELGAALDMYDTLWEGWLPPTTGPDDNNLRPLYHCLKTFKVFICIETANHVDTEEDLEDNAGGGRTGGRGHSYEYLSHYLYDATGNELAVPYKKTRASVDARADKSWLIMDAMEADTPRVPDLTDNHWDAGGNVLFADSHVEWIDRGKWRYEFKNGNTK